MLLMARRWADRLNALRPQLPPPYHSTCLRTWGGILVSFQHTSLSGYATLTTSFALAIINLGGEKNLNKV